ILQGNPGARVDRLRLRVEERLLPAGGAARIKPLERAGAGTGFVGDLHLPRRRRDVDDEGGAQDRVGRGQRKLAPLLGTGDRLDLEVTGIQDEGSILGSIVLAAEIQGRGALQDLALKVDLQVQRNVFYLYLARIAQRVDVPSRRYGGEHVGTVRTGQEAAKDD